jgi:hypothetical protein
MIDELAIAKRNRGLDKELEDTKKELASLRSKLAQSTIEKLAQAGYCLHRGIFLSEKSRRVSCRDCDETLNSFDVLVQYATLERNFAFSLKTKTELSAEIEKLTKVRNSLRSQVRRKGVQP